MQELIVRFGRVVELLTPLLDVYKRQQVDEMEVHLTDIDYDTAKAREKEVRHDVMAHVYTFGKAAPKAAGIIHLGATSAYVGDNTDIIQIRAGLLLVRKKLAVVLDKLARFADAHKRCV